jgi:hypothetical protein
MEAELEIVVGCREGVDIGVWFVYLSQLPMAPAAQGAVTGCGLARQAERIGASSPPTFFRRQDF